MTYEDDRFEVQLRQAAQDYHRPPETPREAMWAAIVAARQHRPILILRPWLRWGLGMAAVLMVGVGLGRWTMRQRSLADASPPAPAPAPAANPSVAYQVAATEYLSRTEALLTGFRAQDPHAALDPQYTRSARDLLTTTRLMLESPAGQDPRLQTLLEDLELVLAQIVQLPSGRRAEEVDLINQGLNQRGVLPRLRTAIPAGPTAVRPQGVL